MNNQSELVRENEKLRKALYDAIDTIRQMPNASFIPRLPNAKSVDIITSYQLADKYENTLKNLGAE